MLLPFRKRLIQWSPLIGGALGSAVIASVVARADAGLLLSGIAGFLWAFTGWIGAHWRQWSKRSGRKNGASWTDALIVIPVVYGFMWCSGVRGEGMIALGVSLNFAYLGAKYRCYLVGCCWARRNAFLREPLLFFGLSLQGFECLMTMFTLLLGFTLFASAYNLSAAVVLFSGHMLVRMFGLYLKLPHRDWRGLIFQPSIAWSALATGAAVFLR